MLGARDSTASEPADGDDLVNSPNTESDDPEHIPNTESDDPEHNPYTESDDLEQSLETESDDLANELSDSALASLERQNSRMVTEFAARCHVMYSDVV